MVNKNKCETCGLRAIFNIKGLKWGRFCKTHKQENMVDVMNKRCEYEEGCSRQPSYNYYEETKARFCSEHKLENMVDIKSKKCINGECDKSPSYNYEDEDSSLYCKDCALPGMINVKTKRCKLCNKIPTYNYEKEKTPLYCCDHKLENMVDIKHKKCEECNKLPSYNYKGENKPRFCTTHKKENMVYVLNDKCVCCNKIGIFKSVDNKHYCKEHSKSLDTKNDKHKKCEKCDVRPSFNYRGKKEGILCSLHKLKDMVNVLKKVCEYDGCEKNAYYKIGDNNIYCKEHSNGKNKYNKCKKEGCDKVPCFNYKEENKGIYCLLHKLVEMVDVSHDKCTMCNDKRANYGYCGQKPSRCSKHKDRNMFIKPRRTCIGTYDNECKEIAIYGIKEPSRCEEHSYSNEICLIESKCCSCLRNDLLDKNNFCLTYCSVNKDFEFNNYRQKIKEETMLKYLDENISLSNNILKVTDDKIVDISCNKYRPDRVYDCGTHMVIVECDEGQHKNRAFCSSFKHIEHAELSRMHEIQNAAGITCIFLRWNPDNFRVEGNLCKKYSNTQRLKLLVKWVEHCFTMVPDKELSPVKYKYLFYDNFNEADISFLEIDDTKLL